MSLTLFEVLSHDERIIVLSNEGNGQVFTWNRSLTLQCFELISDLWEEVDIRTLGGSEPRNYDEARSAAMRWQGEMWAKED